VTKKKKKEEDILSRKVPLNSFKQKTKKSSQSA